MFVRLPRQLSGNDRLRNTMMSLRHGQASVNPLVETVEDLIGRRKTNHLGMCKLLRGD